MELKNVVPKVDEMFGVLEYAGSKEDVTGFVDGRRKVIGKQYHLYSEKQPADDIVVVLRNGASEKAFGYEDKVVLVNPVLEVSGRKIGDSGYASYVLYADDMKKMDDMKK